MKKSQMGRRVTKLFFNELSNAIWQCRCGIRRKTSGSSYANLLSHVWSAHPDYESLLCDDPEESQTRVLRFFSNLQANVMCGWFRLIILCLLPFSFVENKEMREHVKYKPVSLSAFMSYLPRLTAAVERKITDILPDMFALVFDGWTVGSTHYLAVFASFPTDNIVGYSMRLLAMSPMGEEEALTAATHLSFLEYVLSVHEKTMKNVVCLIGDNCNTNKALADLAKVPLICCASHRFNLAVQKILESESEIINKVNALMSKLKNLLLATQLRRLTNLATRTKNSMRWSSVFDILIRYVELREFLKELWSTKMDNLTLNAGEDRRVDELLQQLKKIESVTKRLQKCDTTMSQVRDMFDKVMQDFPETEKRLTPTSNIVHSKIFESAIVKVQNGEVKFLSREEQKALKPLEKVTPATSENGMCGLSYAEQAIQSSASGRSETKYENLSFLIPTSNAVERLFSKSGYALNDRRRGILPANFESQIFLHVNADLWNSSDFVEIMRQHNDIQK